MTGGFFAILDDIGMLLDDAAGMSKVAVKKTAGILGDDLAVNAEKAKGFAASRELPVIFAITKGSFINKLIIVPIILALSYFLPMLIAPILIIGGIYLAYEGAEKVLEYLLDVNHEKREIVMSEKEKIKSAIVTDFILSIEIIVIALSTVQAQPFLIQLSVVSFVAIVATLGVYGIVAMIVRLDDIGFILIALGERLRKSLAPMKYVGSYFYYFGNGLVHSMPIIIKLLTIIGTIAMLLVAGGIFIHNIHQLHIITTFEIPSMIVDFMLALNVGIVVIALKKLVSSIKLLFKK